MKITCRRKLQQILLKMEGFFNLKKNKNSKDQKNVELGL